MDLFYKGHEIFRSIDVLVHAFQRLARNRFESDAEHGAATFGCEFGMRSSCASLEVTPACHRRPRPFCARITSFGRSGVPKKSASLIEMVRAPQFSISWMTSSTGR